MERDAVAYELKFVQSIARGLSDVAAGRTAAHADVMAGAKRLLKPR